MTARLLIIKQAAELAAAVGVDHTRDLQALLMMEASPRPVRMFELAAELGMTSAAITGLVDRLENRELVVRRLIEGDRRGFGVVLSRQGGDLLRLMDGQKLKLGPEVTALMQINQSEEKEAVA